MTDSSGVNNGGPMPIAHYEYMYYVYAGTVLVLSTHNLDTAVTWATRNPLWHVVEEILCYGPEWA